MYKRGIIYIYCYENGAKKSNVGFVREDRGDCRRRMTVCLKSAGRQGCEAVNFYLLLAEGEKVKRFYLDTIKPVCGEICHRHEISDGEIANEGNVIGIAFVGENTGAKYVGLYEKYECMNIQNVLSCIESDDTKQCDIEEVIEDCDNECTENGVCILQSQEDMCCEYENTEIDNDEDEKEECQEEEVADTEGCEKYEDKCSEEEVSDSAVHMEVTIRNGGVGCVSIKSYV